jgi:hypothetical protein
MLKRILAIAVLLLALTALAASMVQAQEFLPVEWGATIDQVTDQFGEPASKNEMPFAAEITYSGAAWSPFPGEVRYLFGEDGELQEIIIGLPTKNYDAKERFLADFTSRVDALEKLTGVDFKESPGVIIGHGKWGRYSYNGRTESATIEYAVLADPSGNAYAHITFSKR